MSRREIPKVEGTAVVLERGVAGGSGAPTQVPLTSAPAAVTVAEIPEPYDQPDATGALTAKERNHLAACEAALDVLRIAFWRAGKALKVISDARLYRESHDTFEAYVVDRWQMQTSQAYRLISAAAVAEPIALSPMGDKINERQVRELLPVADKHGNQAAVDLYLALVQEAANANGSGPKVTANLVQKTVAAAVAALPPGVVWDRDTITQIVRSVLGLTGEQVDDDQAADEAPSAWFETEGSRVATLADKVAKRAQKHPDEARAFAAALIEHARRIEKALNKPKEA
ncbi:hypothetical protein ACQP0C_41615 (plasmid) [Nocardia sp. CA-129566]|uniref:hypothetical protein n=1 Tax=Nocardia sp. CA-129566 TaxID=3239976 RepID=UPI003D95E567